MNAGNLGNVWILLRIVSGVAALALLLRAAWTSRKVLRHFDVSRVTEGQLALERQQELSTTLVRVAAGFTLANLLLTVLLAERLSHSLRGAMCGYGVFTSVSSGMPALGASVVVAVAAGAVSQVIGLDTRVRTLDLAKPLAELTLLLSALAAADLALTLRFLAELDLGVVASCCSTVVDSARGGAARFFEAPRAIAWSALVLCVLAVGSAFRSWKSPSHRGALVSGALVLAAAPLAAAGITLYVAPHLFEVPTHTCPFCLFGSEGAWLGYPLFGGLYGALVWGAGALLSAAFARTRMPVSEVLAPFLSSRFRSVFVTLTAVLAISVASVARYYVVSGGAQLLP